jgi:hypothetical protein
VPLLAAEDEVLTIFNLCDSCVPPPIYLLVQSVVIAVTGGKVNF